jgi:acetyl-CoA C-acetyltransferase
MSRIAILSAGYSDWYELNSAKRPQFYELSYIATKRALENIGMDKERVDIFIESGIDWVNGRLISNMYTNSAIGTYLKDESQAAEDSLLALAYAYMKIKAGTGEVAVVSSVFGGDGDLISISNTVFDPFIYRPIGLTFLHSLALQASSYKLRYKVNDEYAAKAVVKNRNNGANNPRAYLKSKVEIKEVLDSKTVIWPLKESMIPNFIAGAVTIIIAEEDIARRYSKDLVFIEGIKWITDNYYLGSKELYSLDSLRFIANKVYEKHSINDPLKQIDSFEITDVTPYHEFMEYEALGLSNKGKGYLTIDEISNTNLSGGITCTNLFIASGLFKVAEACYQLMGEKGYEKYSFNRVLVHSMGIQAGASSQTNAILLLSR